MKNVSAKRKLRQTPRRHGFARHGAVTPEYNVWHSMINRCLRPTNKTWPHYGGRGIRVCERWETFENFLADMGPRPPKMQIDRIDNDGHYEPGNCRWATAQSNSRNRRSALTIVVDGVAKCAAEWSAISGVDATLIGDRLKRGWEAKRAVFAEPLPPQKGINRGESHGLAKVTDVVVREIRSRYAQGERQRAIAKSLGLSAQTVNNIVHRKGWKHVA